MNTVTNCSQICSHGVYIALGKSFLPNLITLPREINGGYSNAHIQLSAYMNATLHGAGAGADARALLSAFMTDCTSGTGDPPGAFLTGSIVSLLSLVGGCGVV